ncbi:Guanylate kinase [Alloiococcus otitis]|uniref:Guanylate kinase-like domain-containing protein n=1 Tax=Alloiococcus otitis ATCC 51267 TaxID=883081 RepID=K9EPX9_9LACT|nr:AAA family ATPase [Alloiococcus otitis]EKU92947.1 hypothetical protein HMPREF9698_01550 [Alloiococcus otitis ATCC 51267]SUU80458.1 Guanylate kinase [Alloiococcus otitis]
MKDQESKPKKIIILVGPSGSGKTTLGRDLSDKGYKKLVTTTTRKPRPGEVDGRDYYFRDEADLEPSDFVEQTTYNNHTYGLTKAEIEASLKQFDVVHVSLDRNGAQALKELWPKESVVIFIAISEEVMAERMLKRGESQDLVDQRLDYCRRTGELEPPSLADYVLENQDLKESLTRIQAIIEKEI